MSSPARSTASATSAAGQGASIVGGSTSNTGFGDDNSSYHFPIDLITAQDRKEEALKCEITYFYFFIITDFKDLHSFFFCNRPLHFKDVHNLVRHETEFMLFWNMLVFGKTLRIIICINLVET